MPTSATDIDAPTRVTLLRHGEPVGGPRFRGSTDDPLSDQGWAQMQSATTAQDQWDSVITSPLRRCADFARRVAQIHDCPLSVEPDFQEMHYGDWEGQTSETLLQTDGERLQQFWTDAATVTPPGGEPLAAFEQRVTAAWQRWTTELQGQRVLVVTHGGVIRVLLAQVLGTATSRAHRSIAVPYACRSQLRLDTSPEGLLSCLISHGTAE